MRYEICNINDFDERQACAMYAAMDTERRARADRYRFFEDRSRCICADMMARKMLSEASGTAPAYISFTYGERGKPFANVPFEFNVSHSGEYVLCAVSEMPIGVDIEQIKPFRSGMVARYFTDTEAAYVWGDSPVPNGNVTDFDTCKRFYRVWTAKESYAKMTGTGISIDLKQIEFDPQKHTVYGAPLIELEAPEGYVACIVKST